MHLLYSRDRRHNAAYIQLKGEILSFETAGEGRQRRLMPISRTLMVQE